MEVKAKAIFLRISLRSMTCWFALVDPTLVTRFLRTQSRNTHHQLPSGTRCSTARLIIGPGAVIWVPKLLQEIADCRVSASRLSIDPQAMIIEEADRKREARTLVGSIGSTGQGVGYATGAKSHAGALVPHVRLAKNIKSLKPFLRDCREQLERAFSRGHRVFLEGTQGPV